EALAELLEGLLQRGRREDPDRFRPAGTAPVGSSVGGGAAPAADGQHQDPGHGGAQAEGAPHRSSPAGGAPPPGRAGAASITTWVAFTTALATVPGASPSSRAASLLIRDTTRKGPHCSSTCAITRSMTTSVTRPTKRSEERRVGKERETAQP